MREINALQGITDEPKKNFNGFWLDIQQAGEYAWSKEDEINGRVMFGRFINKIIEEGVTRYEYLYLLVFNNGSIEWISYDPLKWYANNFSELY